MAIKGLSELLNKHKTEEIDEATFEAELNKALATDWIPKTKFNELNEEKKLTDKALEGANATLKDLQVKAGLSEEYKAQIDKLNAESVKAQEAFNAQIKKMKMDTAIETALNGAKAKNLKATRALLDESKLLLADDGSVTGLNEQIEALKKDNDFLFGENEQPGSKPQWGGGTKTGGNGGSAGGTGNALLDKMLASAGLNSVD